MKNNIILRLFVCIFAFGENSGSAASSRSGQRSSALHFDYSNFLCVQAKKDTHEGVFFFGGLEEIRTPDPHNANVVRSQLRYKPVYLSIILPEKWLVKGKGGR